MWLENNRLFGTLKNVSANSAWNGHPTLHVTDVAKSSKVQVKVENVGVKLEHVDRGSDEFQFMSQEYCGLADFPEVCVASQLD